MLSAQEVVSFIKSTNNPSESVTKTMKLLYYLQGIHLAAFDEPLFVDKITHHQFGPFVDVAHSQYDFIQASSETVKMSSTKTEFITEVVSLFRNCNAQFLSKKSHVESPWKDTKMGEEITIGSLCDFFSSNPEFGALIAKYSPPPVVCDFSELEDILDSDNSYEDARLEMVRQIKEAMKSTVKV
jgi:uncharacterized phage-associated protein